MDVHGTGIMARYISAHAQSYKSNYSYDII